MNFWGYIARPGSVARAIFGRLAVAALVMCLICPPALAAGLQFPGHDVQAHSTLQRGGSLADDFEPNDRASLDYLRQVHEDPLQLIDEMIASENWEVWQIFQASPGLGVPLIAAQLYIIYSAGTDRMTKRPKVQERRSLPKESLVSDKEYLEEQKTRQQQQRLGIVQERSVQQGLLRVDTKAPRTATTGIRPLNWLFEEDGVFSGRPWDWENFLPRLFTITGLVLGVLMVIEFLHLVIAAGARSLGRRNQRAGQ